MARAILLKLEECCIDGIICQVTDALFQKANGGADNPAGAVETDGKREPSPVES